MSTYSLRAAEVVSQYDETNLNMIDITITFEDGKFMVGALSYQVTASDGSNTAESFMASVSPNGKELHAFFTTDAFDGMSGLVTFEFSYGEPIGTIENVDVPAILTPLPTFLAALNFPDADNAWLAAL
ncbi:MAG TPA: hypothetical protein VF527_16010 [Pyrinomonadaceae bacterium]|jgi:hypothetical protein